MKVLTLVNSLNMGGVEKTLLSCIRNINTEDLDVTICCFKKGGELEQAFKQEGVEIISIKKTGLILFDFIQLLFVLVKGDYDIVHSRFGFTSGGIMLASKICGVKSMVSLHHTEPDSLRSFKKTPFLYFALKKHLKLHKLLTKSLATRIVGHSKSNLDVNYPGWKDKSKFRLLYNGIDFKSLDSISKRSDSFNKFISESTFNILHIGSFRDQKNHLFLLDSFAMLLQKHNDLRLILVGSGGLLDKVKTHAKELQIEDKVYFAGFDVEVSKYYDVSDLFFMPSIGEGLANVVIEAQYKKVPICVSDIKPLYESGYKEYHKYYFSPSDLNECVDKMDKIINDIRADKMQSIKQDARRYVEENFSIATMSKNLLNIYKDVKKNDDSD